ncbi:MAG: hypothetical protein JO257_08155 [Deltaproteobacteria bacterium]|nr:hypothetical protein [Deltaproteobacteria bacterium]
MRRESYGTSTQPQPLRFVENVVLGDARRRGETHQWMYDRINLPVLLEEHGFRDVQIRDHRSSYVAHWDELGLDRNETGDEYKPGSLYVECLR